MLPESKNEQNFNKYILSFVNSFFGNWHGLQFQMVSQEIWNCNKLENMLLHYNEYLGITLNDKIHKNFVISIPTSVSYLGVNIDIAQS